MTVHCRHPTPADRAWWLATLRNIIRAFGEPRAIAPAELRARTPDPDADYRAALRGGR